MKIASQVAVLLEAEFQPSYMYLQSSHLSLVTLQARGVTLIGLLVRVRERGKKKEKHCIETWHKKKFSVYCCFDSNFLIGSHISGQSDYLLSEMSPPELCKQKHTIRYWADRESDLSTASRSQTLYQSNNHFRIQAAAPQDAEDFSFQPKIRNFYPILEQQTTIIWFKLVNTQYTLCLIWCGEWLRLGENTRWFFKGRTLRKL